MSAFIHFSVVLLVLLRMSVAELAVNFTDNYPQPYTQNNKVLGILLNFNLDHSDPLDLIINEFVSMCEGGWEPTMIFMTTMEWSPLMVRYMSEKGYCYRLGRPITMKTDYYDHSIGIGLSAQNRIVISKYLNMFDVFVYLEDDMVFKYHQLIGYLAETKRLSDLQYNNLVNHMIGFQRYRRLRRSPNDLSQPYEESDIFEQELLEERPRFTPMCKQTDPYIVVDVNTHQAMFILTRAQVIHLQSRCNFLNMTRPSREHQSSLFIFENRPHYCAMNKLLPPKQLSTFAIYHYYEQRLVSWIPLFEAVENIKAGIKYYSVGPEYQRPNETVPACWDRLIEQTYVERSRSLSAIVPVAPSVNNANTLELTGSKRRRVTTSTSAVRIKG